MAITKQQLLDLGFKPSRRGGGLSKYKKYDTLIYPIDSTDFLYIGYNQFDKTVNNKKIWKSFKTPEGDRFTYCVISLGETGYNELKDFLIRSKISIQYKALPLTAEEANAPMTVEKSYQTGIVEINESENTYSGLDSSHSEQFDKWLKDGKDNS